jgi:hypothetical protein
VTAILRFDRNSLAASLIVPMSPPPRGGLISDCHTFDG